MSLLKSIVKLAGPLAVGIVTLGCEDFDEQYLGENPGEEELSNGLEIIPESQRVEVAPQVPSDWIGHRIGASPGTWRHMGNMRMATADEKFVMPILDTDKRSAPNPNPHSMVIGDPVSKKLYEVEMAPADLAKIANVLRRAGADAPTEFADDPIEEDVAPERGWSNGIDNRIDRGDGKYAQSTWPYRTIGQLKRNGLLETHNGHCTATFIGSAGDANTRYIVTASHCLWSGAGTYLDPDFWPRQDRCLDNQGNAIAGCDQGPYGEWDGGQWMMYTYFVNNCVGIAAFTAECSANDIAVMRVHRRPGASFPGAMGFAAWNTNDLNGVGKYHRGYPNCNGSGDPVPAAPFQCLPRTLYGDNAFSIDNGSSVQNGWPRRYAYSADLSPGHSGGPSYFYDNGNVYVFGTASTESCSGAACVGFKVNHMRNVTWHWYNAMLNFMGL